jgi:hypothetical protein
MEGFSFVTPVTRLNIPNTGKDDDDNNKSSASFLISIHTPSITGKMASTLMTWERKILRKIYGQKSEQGIWRIRSNLEIQNMYKSPDIVTEIKVRRLEWLGHVVRMQDTRLPKMVLNAKPEGRREVGRPRLRWVDDVEADIKKALGVKRWRIKAQDRKERSAILREAKAKLKGP